MTGPEIRPDDQRRSRDGQPATATYDVAIVGAGYVGVPLAQVFAEAGRSVVLVDVDAEARRAAAPRRELHRGRPVRELAGLVPDARRSRATTDYDVLRDADAILIALPTPLSRQREPDLSIVLQRRRRDRHAAAAGSPRRARVDDVPGTTRDALQPVLERASGLVAGGTSTSPSRRSASTPAASTGRRRTSRRSSAAIDEASTEAAAALYGTAVDTIHRVSSPEAAELTKLLENIFRSVNIALVNELAQLCDRMGIDIWEVVDAAATKPFGFMRFQPGPGPRRALHPDRPLLPHLEGAGVRLHDAVHRARGQGQPEHAVLLPLARLAGAQPRRAQVALARRGSSCSASPTRPTSPTCGSRPP